MKLFKEDHARLDAIMETEKSGVASGVKPGTSGETEEGGREVVPREPEEGEREVVPHEPEEGGREVVPREEMKAGGEQSTATGKSDDST